MFLRCTQLRAFPRGMGLSYGALLCFPFIRFSALPLALCIRHASGVPPPMHFKVRFPLHFLTIKRFNCSSPTPCISLLFPVAAFLLSPYAHIRFFGEVAYPIHPALFDWYLVYPFIVSHAFPARFLPYLLPRYIPGLSIYYPLVYLPVCSHNFPVRFLPYVLPRYIPLYVHLIFPRISPRVFPVCSPCLPRAFPSLCALISTASCIHPWPDYWAFSVLSLFPKPLFRYN